MVADQHDNINIQFVLLCVCTTDEKVDQGPVHPGELSPSKVLLGAVVPDSHVGVSVLCPQKHEWGCSHCFW